MVYIRDEVRRAKNIMTRVLMLLEKNGDSELVVRVLSAIEEISEVECVMCEGDEREELSMEIAKAVEEISEKTGKPLSEVLDQAKAIYDRYIEEIRESEVTNE